MTGTREGHRAPPEREPEPETVTPPEPEAVTPPEPPVEALCRGAERLLRLAGPRVRRVRLCSGNATVLVEWHAPPGRGTGRGPGRDGRLEERAGPESALPLGDGDSPLSPMDSGGRDGPDDDTSTAADAPLRICAPCVGTFYHAPQPGAAPFVEPGDTVAAGDQVGLVEAMKLMTPVEADAPGRVVRVLVPDGTPVEFGQPLLALAPSAPPTGG